MNDFLSYRIYNNEVQEILISLAFILGAIVLGRLVRWFAEKILPKLTAKTETQLDDVLVEVLKAPMLFALTLVGFWIGIKRLSMPANVMEMMADAYKFLLVISATWFVSRAVSTFINVVLKEKVNDESSRMDEHALSLIKKVSSFVIWSIGVITALNNAGVDVGALIAGLGIGGVAIALAAQDTAKNIFAGMVILFDRPFKIGEPSNHRWHDRICRGHGNTKHEAQDIFRTAGCDTELQDSRQQPDEHNERAVAPHRAECRTDLQHDAGADETGDGHTPQSAVVGRWH